MIAITHAPSPALQEGERTFVDRAPIDFRLAVEQHAEYCRLLRYWGAEVVTLDVNAAYADSVFIEDVAIVFDEAAVLTSMGTPSRRGELAGVEPVLRQHRSLFRIELPATVEGGDVLRVGRTFLVGLSSRTNAAGVESFAGIVRRFGYDVRAVPVHECLHLKTSCTALPDGRLLVNPAWIDQSALAGCEWVRIPADEPWAANVALVGDSVWIAADHVRTAEMIAKLGFHVQPVDISEFAKAEGGVTCLSLLF